MRFIRRLCTLILFCLVDILSPSFAAESGNDPVQAGLALIQDALQRNTLPADTSAALKQLLDRIQEAQTRKQQAEIRAALAEKLIEQTQRELQQLTTSRPADFADLRLTDDLSPSERAERLRRILEEERARRQTQESLKAQLADLEQPKERRDSAAPPSPAPLPPLPSNDPLVQQALTLATLVSSQAQEAERRAALLESRLAENSRVLLSRRIERLEVELTRLRQLREAVEKSTTAEVTQETSQADAGTLDPRLARVEATNREWEARLQTLRQRLQTVRERQATLQREHQERRESLESLKKRIAQQGLSPAVGNLLLEYRSRLPAPVTLRQELNAVRAMLEEVQLLELELRQAKRLIADPRERARQLLGLAETTDSPLEKSIIEALSARTLTLETLDALRPALLAALGDLESVLLRELGIVNEFSTFIEQHLMWVPTTRSLWHSPLSELTAVGSGILTLAAALIDRASWQTVVFHTTVKAWALLGLGLIFLLARPRLNARLDRLLGKDRKESRSAGILDILSILGLEALQSLPFPLVAYALGMIILDSGVPAENAHAFGLALTQIAPFAWNVLFWQRIFSPKKGLAASRYHWPMPVLQRLNHTLKGFAWGVLPLGFLALYLNQIQLDAPLTELGRIPFVLSMLLLSWLLWRIFHIRRGLLTDTPLPTWIRVTAALFGPGLPLVSAVLASAGYFYAATALIVRFMSTLWILLAFALLQHAARDFFLQRFERRRSRSAEDGDETQQERIDASERQTLTLLNFALVLGLVFVLLDLWSSLLPATRILDEWVLWRYTEALGNEAVTMQVTLADLLLALIGFAAMWVAARNLPGLLEVALQRTSRLDAGSKYALVTLLRYAIFTIGLILILGQLGMPWSKLQWLLAALSVGLGFGLQEIVANFVSGLIILFERPVRVGDLVTIGSDSGTVRRLTIRATVIEDFDRREILVPNKKLITEQVTNWTLSNSLARIFITIGVAYGSDPKQIEALLLEAIKATPGILSDPAPSVIFARFGESSLDFEIRAIVANVDQRLGIMSRLNEEIDRIFKENGVEIPFPQRDLHIRDIAWPRTGPFPAGQNALQPPES